MENLLNISDVKTFDFLFGATPVELLDNADWDAYLEGFAQVNLEEKALYIKGEKTEVTSELPRCVLDLVSNLGELDRLTKKILDKVLSDLPDYQRGDEPTKEELKSCLEDLQNLQGGSWLIYSKDIFDFVFEYNEELSDYINANDVEEYIDRVDLSNGLISASETLYFQVLPWIIGDLINSLDND